MLQYLLSVSIVRLDNVSALFEFYHSINTQQLFFSCNIDRFSRFYKLDLAYQPEIRLPTRRTYKSVSGLQHITIIRSKR